MFFTQEDYRKIEHWLSQRTIRDTQFPITNKLKKGDLIPIVQESNNRNILVDTLIEKINRVNSPDVYNVSDKTGQYKIPLKCAINLIPVESRKLGLVITFYNCAGEWSMYQFCGENIAQWGNKTLWTNILSDMLKNLYPDEESITVETIDGKSYLKLKERKVNTDYCSTGYKILHKNLTSTGVCSEDGEEVLINVLKQDAIMDSNTIYVIRYDFDLNGNFIKIPRGSTLSFEGGTINNGSVILDDTAVLGVLSPDEMGTAIFGGTYRRGQIMSFVGEGPEFKKTLQWYNGTKWTKIVDPSDIEELNETIEHLRTELRVTIQDVSNLTARVRALESR